MEMRKCGNVEMWKYGNMEMGKCGNVERMMARRHLWHNTRYNTMYNNTVQYDTMHAARRYNTIQ